MIIFAHRGDSGHAPENTLHAFKSASEKKVYGIELDVQLTADGEIVVIHDALVDRTTDGSGMVRDYSLDKLRRLDAGMWYGDAFKGTRIPTLQEVVDCIDKNIIINIEVKIPSVFRGRAAEVINRFIEKNDLSKRVILSSFDHQVLVDIKALNPALKIGVLFYSYPVNVGAYIENLRIEVYSVHMSKEFVDKALVDTVKSIGKKAFVYTVDTPMEKALLTQIGVDGIFSNNV